MFNKILIANRGEIACRVIRTAKKLGVSTVSVYSDADRHSKHVRMADEAYHIGGSTPLESYLNYENVLNSALDSGAQGIHPGYGFLSENPTFTDLCEKNGVKFIGPPSKAMIQMASKSESKDIMLAAGVPCTPGYHGDNQDPEYLLEEAKKIQFPVMIKAVMGGGGKGMKISWNQDDFLEQLESAKRESMKGFNDDRVLIEKYIQKPKHYEIQVIGDSHGNYVYLFERDCSIQRRHQKIIEEAPSSLTHEQRTDMGEKAVAAAKAVGYVNAGTVEFLYDLDTNNFYFMEMNTRLQVEHPITEEITGVDLVEWQLKIASGQELPVSQADLSINGHAIEARVYSEDPFTFLPGRGTVDYYKEPNWARVDSGVEAGSDVGIFYDPMISKLIVWGEDRDIAVQKMRRAISEYKIGGLVTNLSFLNRVVDHPQFQEFDYNLKFIEDFDEVLIPKKISLPDRDVIISAFLHAFWNPSGNCFGDLSNFRVNNNLTSPFKILINHAYSTNETTLTLKGEIVQVTPDNFNIQYTILSENGEVFAEGEHKNVSIVEESQNSAVIILEGKREVVEFYEKEGDYFLFDTVGHCYKTHSLYDVVEMAASQELVDKDQIRSPMPGVVVQINVKKGDSVKKGTVVAILEAMKMEHQIIANSDIVIEEVNMNVKDFVEAGQPLFKLEETE